LLSTQSRFIKIMFSSETFSFHLLAILFKFCRNYTCILFPCSLVDFDLVPVHMKKYLSQYFYIWASTLVNKNLQLLHVWLHVHTYHWQMNLFHSEFNNLNATNGFMAKPFTRHVIYCDIWWWFWLSDLDISLLSSILVIIYIHPDYRLSVITPLWCTTM